MIITAEGLWQLFKIIIIITMVLSTPIIIWSIVLIIKKEFPEKELTEENHRPYYD